jgi:hypothetical protein
MKLKKWYFMRIGTFMMGSLKRKIILIFGNILLAGTAVHAQNLNTVGVTLLQALGTNFNGTSIRVAQPEAPLDAQGTEWEVDPTNVNQPVSLFTYFYDGTSTNAYPNSLGADSSHADAVGSLFYGPSTGVATNVSHVDNYDANYFALAEEQTIGSVTNYIVSLPSSNIDDPVVNQSFIFANSDYSHVASNEEAAINLAYDTYAAQYNTLFVSGAGNGTPTYVNPPATCFNGIGVGVSDGASSIGPTADGRCKPDLIAPGGETSFSTPLVAGSAAVLMQAALRGDGGGDTNSAANIITIKALLLNGAIKAADWANSSSTPLDFRYGAGVLNVFNSYEQLAAGKHSCNFSTNIPEGSAHPPVATSASVPVLSGWDFSTNTSTTSYDEVRHYFFNVTNNLYGADFTLTATLVWNRHTNQTAINNLNLFLYNAANSNLVAASTSMLDNVQHVFIPQLPQGRYDLQVWKAGGSGIVSTSEPYALAWGIFSESLNVTESGANLILSWPAYPQGFAVAATASLTSPAWSTNSLPAPVFTNNQDVVWLNAAGGMQFFRLQTPDF